MAPIHSFLIHGGGGEPHVQVTMPFSALVALANVTDAEHDEFIDEGYGPNTAALAVAVHQQLAAMLDAGFGTTWRDPVAAEEA